MTLSIKKLNLILNNKGLVPTRYYTIHSYYYSIETISIKNGESILIWIPEKYKISFHPQDVEFNKNYPHFKLKSLNIDNSGGIVDKYGCKIDPDNYYQDIDLKESVTTGGRNIESILEENYQNCILLDQVDNKYLVKTVYKQLNRLKNCVKYVSYKLAIFTEKYLCITNTRNQIDCYYIKHHPESSASNKKLFVVISLETALLSESNVEGDVKSIYDGIQTLLEKNQKRHPTYIYHKS